MKKRIAIIIPGGVGVGRFSQGIPILENFLERLAKNYEVTVFPLGRVDKGYVPKGFKLKPIADDYSRPLIIRLIKTSFLIIVSHFQNKFAVFHGVWTFPSGFLAVLFGKLFRKKSIVSLQGGGIARIKEINYGGRMRKSIERCILWSLRQTDVITAESDFQRRLIPNIAIQKKAKVIPYGVDLRLFKYRPKKIAPTYQFIHVANLNPVKDQITLLKCFKVLSEQIDCRLTIIGPDYLNGKLQRFARQEGIADKVSFLGFIQHIYLPEYLKKAHIMLHTSRHEGMPVAAVEAMASGVVVCGTSVGVIADLSPRRCLAVEIGDYQALADKVIALLQEEKRLAKIRQSALRWAKEHPIEWTVKEFEKLYFQAKI